MAWRGQWSVTAPRPLGAIQNLTRNPRDKFIYKKSRTHERAPFYVSVY